MSASNRKYQVVRSLAVGGMAEVWVARPLDEPTRTVVLKRPRRDLAVDPEFIELFRREAHLHQRSRHPNIVPFIEFGTDDDGPYIVLEFVEGPHIQAISAAETLPHPCATAKIGAQIAWALAELHERGPEIVHRDISPENIVIALDGNAMLIDFGIAFRRKLDHSEANEVRGKLQYIAPELQYSHKSDQFALGRTLESLVSDADDDDSTEGRALRAALARCVAEHPLERFPDCRALARTLETVASAVPADLVEAEIVRIAATAKPTLPSANTQSLIDEVALIAGVSDKSSS
ncbi:MAG: serine/threonine-protein kinase [Deltaproteobacteria bacterium]